MRIVPEDAILIPANAEQVFKGKIFDVYQWPQELFDGSTATFEMLRRPDTVLAVCLKDDKIVLIYEQQPTRPYYVRLPGGRVDPGEDWLPAVQREIEEELGQRYKNWRLVDVHQPETKIEWFVATYLADNLIEEIGLNHGSGERIEFRELSFDEVKRQLVGGSNPVLNFSRPLFDKVNSLEELRNLPEFTGKVID